MHKSHATGLLLAAAVFSLLPGARAATPTPPAATLAERQHLSAVALFREARFPAAYGRFIALADAGHAPSAAYAVWMYRNGPTLFGRNWDLSPDQLCEWSRLTGQPALPSDGCATAQREARLTGARWAR